MRLTPAWSFGSGEYPQIKSGLDPSMNPAMNFVEYTSHAHAPFSSGLRPHFPFVDFPKHSGAWSQESLFCHWAASWNLGPCNKRPWWSRTAKSPGLGYDKLNFIRTDISNSDFLKTLKSSNSSLERRCAFEGLLVWFPPLKDRPVRMIFVSWTHTPSPEKWGLVMTSWRLLMGTIWLLTLYRTSTSGQWWG